MINYFTLLMDSFITYSCFYLCDLMSVYSNYTLALGLLQQTWWKSFIRYCAVIWSYRVFDVKISTVYLELIAIKIFCVSGLFIYVCVLYSVAQLLSPSYRSRLWGKERSQDYSGSLVLEPEFSPIIHR